MSNRVLAAIALHHVLRPTKLFAELAEAYVPVDDITGSVRYERATLQTVTDGPPRTVAVVGGIGGGKSSLIAHVCVSLPADHVALRAPVVGADDPTSVSDMAAMMLSSALDALLLDAKDQQELERARASDATVERTPRAFTGGKLGGGHVPLEVNVDLGTLREQFHRNQLGGDRLIGLQRLVEILEAYGLHPVFVLEDTEAALGRGPAERIEAFFSRPVRALLQEVSAPLLIAVQTHLVEGSATFAELKPAFVVVELPHLSAEEATAAVRAAIELRLASHDIDAGIEDVISDDGLREASEYLRRTGGNWRLTLAVLQSAAEAAGDAGGDVIDAPHIRESIEDWPPPV